MQVNVKLAAAASVASATFQNIPDLLTFVVVEYCVLELQPPLPPDE